MLIELPEIRKLRHTAHSIEDHRVRALQPIEEGELQPPLAHARHGRWLTCRADQPGGKPAHAPETESFEHHAAVESSVGDISDSSFEMIGLPRNHHSKCGQVRGEPVVRHALSQLGLVVTEEVRIDPGVHVVDR